jgi:hypothetical protein
MLLLLGAEDCQSRRTGHGLASSLLEADNRKGEAGQLCRLVE